MKKGIVMIGIILCMMVPAYANTREEVRFSKCTDGDTAHLFIDKEDKTVRFLAVDTPEYTKEKEAYGKEASAYTCHALENAKRIELEYDDASDKEDKYGRVLAWVFVDGELLQKKLVEEGLGEVAYLYGDYTYTEELQEAEKIAKQKQVNMWSGVEPEEDAPFYIYILLAVGSVMIIGLRIFNVKGKNAKIRKIKKAMNKIKK